MKILLIEPDRLLAANLIDYFGRAGHTVDWQVSPQESIDFLDHQPVEAVILDLALCAHSAIEMLYEMRSYNEWKDIPVIIFSSLPAREIISCAASLDQLGVRAYHHKSSTPLSDLLLSVELHCPAKLVA